VVHFEGWHDLISVAFFILITRSPQILTVHFKFKTTSMQILNLSPWRDPNPRSAVLEADSITTMPGRLGLYINVSQKRNFD
jgi:hypothetical protein